MPALPLSRFHYDPATKTLSAEASDLGRGWFCRPKALQSPYIEIHSPTTGNIERFLLRGIRKDQEGDILSWRFTPARNLPTVKEVIVFND